MRRIWRLETDIGKGVYTAGVAHYICNADPVFDRKKGDDWTTGRCRTPCADPIIGDWWYSRCNPHERPNWYFGFTTLAQYRSWFFTKKARSVLAGSQILLRLYEVPNDDFKRGATQAVFQRHRQQLIETRSPAYCDGVELQQN